MNLFQDIAFDMRLKHCSTMIVAGPTQAGKTTFVDNLLANAHWLFEEEISKIYWICNEIPLQNLNPKYTYIEGLPDDFSFVEKNSVVVIDDLMDAVNDSGQVSKLFTEGTHHKRLFVIYITQNYYMCGKHDITKRRNCQYVVIFKNPADSRQIRTIGDQMFPECHRLLPEAYRDAVKGRAHGYLFIDLRQKTPEFLRIRANVLPHELPMVVYKQTMKY